MSKTSETALEKTALEWFETLCTLPDNTDSGLSRKNTMEA